MAVGARAADLRQQLLGASAIPTRDRVAQLLAIAERFVRSVNESCVVRMIFFGESSLRRAICEFALQSQRERNHQALEKKIIQPEFMEFPVGGPIRSRQRLGGLLRYYYRDAA